VTTYALLLNQWALSDIATRIMAGLPEATVRVGQRDLGHIVGVAVQMPDGRRVAAVLGSSREVADEPDARISQAIQALREKLDRQPIAAPIGDADL